MLIIGFIAKRYRDKKYPKAHPLHKYYLPGLWVKFGGAVFIGLIYAYYYKGGDTFVYFNYARVVNSSLEESFETWVKLLLRVSPNTDPKLYPYASQIEFYNDPASYAVISITAILGLLNFTSYLPIALLFAYISYTGIWAMFKTFYSFYPKLVKQLAIAFLFVPSVLVWGSSIFKDTVCMFGLGWMTYTTFRIFVNKDLSLKNFLLLALSFYMVAVIKIYILLAFLPALLLWLLLSYSHKVKNTVLRIMLTTMVLGFVVFGFFYFSTRFSKELNRYSLENIVSTAESTRGWIVYSSGDEGSAYDIGKIDPSLTGIMSTFPEGVAVTLYRPFLWEVKKPIMFLSAFESFTFIILTLMVFFRNGIFVTFKKIFNDANLLFFFTFALIFAFAVGISTGNFGTLSRYKIPCMPYFAALLLVLFYQSKAATSTKKQTHKNVQQRPVHHIT